MNIRFVRETRRAIRLNHGLNVAIRKGDAAKIKRWQKLQLPFYGISYSDWLASQINNKDERGLYSTLDKE